MRELLVTDCDGLFELDSDPEVHRYLGKQPLVSKDQCLEVIGIIRQQYADNGIGRWAVVEKSTGEFLGWCGLKLVKETVNDHTLFYDLGYRFIKKHWGRGIATESAMASVAYGFNALQLQTIYACADIQNQASQNVLTKLGFNKTGSFYYESEPHYWFKISKPF